MHIMILHYISMKQTNLIIQIILMIYLNINIYIKKNVTYIIVFTKKLRNLKFVRNWYN